MSQDTSNKRPVKLREISIGWPTILFWLSGIALAKGFFPTLAALVFPPYAFYVVIERALVYIGWIAV